MNVFFATPAYDGSCVEAFEKSIRETLEALKESGIPARWECHSGCCYLPIARNKLVQRFLASDATDLVFLDADISWDVEAIEKLLSWPVEIVAGAYRVKEHEDRYPVWKKTDPSGIPVMGGLSGLIECWGVPTGFLRIHRSVFEAMQRHYGEELEVDDFEPGGTNKIGTYLNFFDTEKRGRQWFGEDINFCRRWTMEMHRPLWVDPTIRLTHWGSWPNGSPRPFESDFDDYLRRLPGGDRDPGYQGTDIPGYLRKMEAQWLYASAKEMNSVVEIGSFCGRSAHALLSGCPGTVVCVDTWAPMEWYDASQDEPVRDTAEQAETRYRTFLENTKPFGDRLTVARMSSEEASRTMHNLVADMVWIDGDHQYDSVVADIVAWSKKTRKLICGHDYDDWGWPDVKKAVDDIFGSKVKTYGSIWYVEL